MFEEDLYEDRQLAAYKTNEYEANQPQILNNLKMLATLQEAQVYKQLSNDWKAQLDPNVRKWMQTVRDNFIAAQQQKQKQKCLYEPPEQNSYDFQTLDIQIDDYLQI